MIVTADQWSAVTLYPFFLIIQSDLLAAETSNSKPVNPVTLDTLLKRLINFALLTFGWENQCVVKIVCEKIFYTQKTGIKPELSFS